MEHDLKMVLTAAVAAQRINGTYVRRDQGTVKSPANSNLMFQLLAPDPEETYKILPEDIQQSQLIMEYLSHKLMDLVAGDLEDYWKNAVMLLGLENIKITDFKKLGLIASIPTSYNNAVARDSLQDHMRHRRGTRCCALLRIEQGMLNHQRCQGWCCLLFRLLQRRDCL